MHAGLRSLLIIRLSQLKLLGLKDSVCKHTRVSDTVCITVPVNNEVEVEDAIALGAVHVGHQRARLPPCKGGSQGQDRQKC